MSTQPTPLPYQPYTNPNIQFNQGRASSTSDPRKIASNQLEEIRGQGDALQSTDQNLANQYAQQASGTQQYLNPIESNLAQGGGGYSAAEQGQIELTPQQQQNIVTGAGISSGVGTAANVAAAERASNASGGNPQSLATYRARAAQTQGAQAGDSETQARIAAQQAGSQGAQAVGQARMGQQAQGLGYYGGLQGQQQQSSLAEQGLQNQAFGTETAGTGAASQLGVEASQTPSTFGQIMGGISGAATGAAAAGLADGTSGYMDGGMDAVLGENGPEMIVEGASDPVRSDTKFMAGGGFGVDSTNDQGQPMSGAPAQPGTGGLPAWLQTYLNPKTAAPAATPAPAAKPAYNSATPWTQLGTTLGTIGGNAYKHLNQPASGTPGSISAGGTGAPLGSVIQDPMDMSSAASGLADVGEAGIEAMADGGMSGGYRSRLMADGSAPDSSATGLPAAPSFAPNKLITQPTRVHLDKGDAVVPLSYRPQAKVRPSMALEAMSAKPRLLPKMRHTYGGIHA